MGYTLLTFMKLFCVLFIMFNTSFVLYGQTKQVYNIHTIAFYNLENLFDTVNDTLKFDEYSPIMDIKTNRSVVYKKKVHNMARVISEIGFDVTHNTPAIIGVAEVETRKVLADVVNDTALVHKNYGIIHYPSPDIRGIDVALLYQKALFTPISSSSHELRLYDNTTQKRIYTRDQLLVSGELDGELLHLIVNHWPSRSGGEARSGYKRLAAARLTKYLTDSIQNKNPDAKIVIMGDFNDNPNNHSIKSILKAENDKTQLELKALYNPYAYLFKKGIGTTAYRDNWSLFDQILLTQPLLKKDFSSYRFYKAGIFNKHYLITKTGTYKGYPFRSWSNGGFSDGFSDHFPVYIYVIKGVD